jgi:hypothetical protein
MGWKKSGKTEELVIEMLLNRHFFTHQAWEVSHISTPETETFCILQVLPLRSRK